MTHNQGNPKERKNRDYIYHDLTRSICPVCHEFLDAKIVFKEDGKVYMLKRCPEHGEFEVLIASDVDYYCNLRPYNKQGSIPLEFSSEIKDGCPKDCGLCPDHEQHTCLALIEITNRCNMACPICYADSGQGKDLSLEEIRFMMERYKASEGQPEVLQISGGEPTLHPQIHEILKLAREIGFKAFLINTNGLRLAQDREFVASLTEFGPELEIYLQFDSLSPEVGEKLRGQDMQQIRLQALDNLEEYGIYANLVVTLAQGVNVEEIGPVINAAINRPYVTGVILQTMTGVGRGAGLENNPQTRLTVPDIVKAIEEQTQGTFKKDDFLPLPCSYPTCCSLTYAFILGEEKKKVKPITRYFDVHKYLDYYKNTMCVDPRELLNEAIFHSVDRLWSASASLKLVEVLKDFSKCCGVKFKPEEGTSDPLKQIPGKPLRIVIKPFMDAYNYDLKRAKKCCIHVLTTEGKMIPFCNYNIFHRC